MIDKESINHVVIDKGESFTVERKWVIIGSVNLIILAFTAFTWISSIQSDLDSFKKINEFKTRDRITKKEVMLEIQNIDKKILDIVKEQERINIQLHNEYKKNVENASKCLFLEQLYKSILENTQKKTGSKQNE